MFYATFSVLVDGRVSIGSAEADLTVGKPTGVLLFGFAVQKESNTDGLRDIFFGVERLQVGRFPVELTCSNNLLPAGAPSVLLGDSRETASSARRAAS